MTEKTIKYIWENKVYNEKPKQITDYMEYEEFIWEDWIYYRNYMEKDWIRLVRKVLDHIGTDLSTKTEKFLKTIGIVITIWIIWIFIYLYNIQSKIKENTNIKSNIIITKIKENNKIISWEKQKINNIENKLNNIDIDTLNHFMYIYKDKINNLYYKKQWWQK